MSLFQYVHQTEPDCVSDFAVRPDGGLPLVLTSINLPLSLHTGSIPCKGGRRRLSVIRDSEPRGDYSRMTSCQSLSLKGLRSPLPQGRAHWAVQPGDRAVFMPSWKELNNFPNLPFAHCSRQEFTLASDFWILPRANLDSTAARTQESDIFDAHVE